MVMVPVFGSRESRIADCLLLKSKVTSTSGLPSNFSSIWERSMGCLVSLLSVVPNQNYFQESSALQRHCGVSMKQVRIRCLPFHPRLRGDGHVLYAANSCRSGLPCAKLHSRTRANSSHRALDTSRSPWTRWLPKAGQQRCRDLQGESRVNNWENGHFKNPPQKKINRLDFV